MLKNLTIKFEVKRWQLMTKKLFLNLFKMNIMKTDWQVTFNFFLRIQYLLSKKRVQNVKHYDFYALWFSLNQWRSIFFPCTCLTLWYKVPDNIKSDSINLLFQRNLFETKKEEHWHKFRYIPTNLLKKIDEDVWETKMAINIDSIF